MVLQFVIARFLGRAPVADREVDPWVFSRKGKQGGSDAYIGRSGGVMPPVFLILQESWQKVENAVREMATELWFIM